MNATKPAVFIGSSSEHLPVADALREHLRDVATPVIWQRPGVFALSQSYLQSLLEQLEVSDFAIFVLGPDDVVRSRGKETSRPRDNVVFELGLFMGRLGPTRCAIVAPAAAGAGRRAAPLALPSDLAGIHVASYPARPARSERGVPVTRACRLIRLMIRREGQRDLPALVEGKWIELKNEAKRPYALLEFTRRGGSVAVQGDSYTADGERYLHWPKDVDFAAVEGSTILHCFDAEHVAKNGSANGKTSRATGVSRFVFDVVPGTRTPPTRGRGRYETLASGGGIETGATAFELRRVTGPYRRFLLPPGVRPGGEDDAMMRRLAQLRRTRCVVITGGPGCGKTTLLQELVRRTGLPAVEEAGIRVIKRLEAELGSHEKGLARRRQHVLEFQRRVLEEQRWLDARHLPDRGTVFMDRSGVDGLAYLRFRGLAPDEDLLTYAEEMRFAAVFLLETPAAFEARPETGRATSRADSIRLFHLLSDVYREHGHDPIWLPAETDVTQRVELVLARLGVVSSGPQSEEPARPPRIAG